ncbi:MAG: hypothetical protein M3Z23_02055 [Acidobacteriota bacterium]|nr:hypothetical protein [Acidobacteriota bacterium]
MKLQFAWIGVFALALTGAVTGFAQDGTTSAKPSVGQSASRLAGKSTRNRKADQAATAATPAATTGVFSSGELVAQGFTIAGNTCMDFDSSQDFSGADRVSINIFALNANISGTQIIPLFGVPNSPYLSPTSDLIDGNNFIYSDGGGGSVGVGGSDLRIRVCNNSKNSMRYDQLTAYATGAQFAGNHF